MIAHLSSNEIRALFSQMKSSGGIEVTRIRYKNRQEIRRTTLMTVAELQNFILASCEDGHQPGGDLEVTLDDKRILVGHHDGVYWIKGASFDTPDPPDDRG